MSPRTEEQFEEIRIQKREFIINTALWARQAPIDTTVQIKKKFLFANPKEK